MKILWAAVAIVTAVIVQVLVSGIWPPMARFFDLPLIPVLYYAIAKGPSGALLVGTGAGLLQDSLEGTLLGVSAMSKALVGYLVGIMGLRLSLVPLASRIVAVAVASVLSRSFEVVTLAIMGRRIASTPYSHLFESILGNCVLGVLVIGALTRERLSDA